MIYKILIDAKKGTFIWKVFASNPFVMSISHELYCAGLQERKWENLSISTNSKKENDTLQK